MELEMFFEGGILAVTCLRSACIVLPTYCLLQMLHVARYTKHREAHVPLKLVQCVVPDTEQTKVPLLTIMGQVLHMGMYYIGMYLNRDQI